MKKILSLVIGLSVLVSFTLAVSVVHAAVATPTPTPSPTPTPTTGVNDIREAIRQEVQKRIGQNPTKQPTAVGVVGTITSIQATENLITISTVRQGEKIASVSAQTTMVRVSPNGERKQVKLDNAAVGDNIIAMGQVSETGPVLTGRVILFTAVAPKRFVYLGNVIGKTAAKLTIKQVKSGQSLELDYANDTIAKKSEGDKVSALKMADLKVGDLVIVTGSQEANKAPEISLAVRLSQPAASPTATPRR